jgi:hypothetical protein
VINLDRDQVLYIPLRARWAAAIEAWGWAACGRLEEEIVAACFADLQVGGGVDWADGELGGEYLVPCRSRTGANQDACVGLFQNDMALQTKCLGPIGRELNAVAWFNRGSAIRKGSCI